MSKIGALRAKITHNFWGSNQHELGKKWAQNAPFASIFQKFSRGRPPRTPTCRRGSPPPAPSPCGASRRFGYAPRQWTLWIRHWSPVLSRAAYKDHIISLSVHPLVCPVVSLFGSHALMVAKLYYQSFHRLPKLLQATYVFLNTILFLT